MTLSTAPKRPAMSEAELQAAVVALAGILGWRVNHTRRSIGKGARWTTATSIVGWPDLEIIGHGRVLYRELKAEKGKLTEEQADVLRFLRANGQDAEVWRPSDLDSGRIQNELRRRRVG